MARRPLNNAVSGSTDEPQPPPVAMRNTPRERLTFSFRGSAINAKQVSIALPNDQNGVVIPDGNAEKWYVRAATLRGGWRHSSAHQVLAKMRQQIDPNARVTTATGRLLNMGGVKSSGAARIMTPIQIDDAKLLNPLIEMYGCNDPAFFSGSLFVSHMMSEMPIIRGPNTNYHLQVVRRPFSHGLFTVNDLIDPEKIAEGASINRYRSQIENAGKLIYRLSRRTDDNSKQQLIAAYEEMEKLTTRKFTSPDEVRDFITSEKSRIQASGHSTVSEQTIPQGQEVIPIGVPMLHSMLVVNCSAIGVGLLMDGISAKSFRHPVIGGRAASGCGGYFTSKYDVFRMENDADYVLDCSIELVPEQHVIFHNAEHSRLKDCLDQWREADINQFDFTFEGLGQLVNGGAASAAVPDDE